MGRLMRAAAPVVLALASGGCWPATGAGPDRRAYNDVEVSVTAATAPTLAEEWTATTAAGPRGVSSPVVSPAGLVHVTTESSVYGIDLVTGAIRWVEAPYAEVGGAIVDTQMSVGPLPGDGDHLYVSILRGGTGWENAAFQTVDGWWFSEFFGRQEGIRAAGTELRAAFSTYSAVGSILRQGLTTFGENVVDVAVTDHPGSARFTVGTDLVFQAGSGLMATGPGDGTEGVGLRAIPYSGGASDCGAPGDAVFACPAWVVPLDGRTATTPVLSADGGTVYVGTDAGTVTAVATATGAVLWSAPVGSAVAAPPALAPDALLVPTTSGVLVALDPAGCGAATCAPSWSSVPGEPLLVQPGAATDVVVVGARDGTVAAYPTAGCGQPTCAPVWTVATGSPITGAPAITRGRVLVGTADGRVIAFAPAAP